MTGHMDPKMAQFQEELQRYNKAGEAVARAGVGAPGPVEEGHGHTGEDAIAFLTQIPEPDAIEKAREWTGDQSINSLDEAIAAVQQALGGQ